MVKVLITPSLFEKIQKTFKGDANKVIDLLETLEENPKKGKEVGCVGSIVIKEIRYKVYRFYFITDGFKIKFLKDEELSDLLIKFIRMSDKDNQQRVIDEIKNILRNLGPESF